MRLVPLVAAVAYCALVAAATQVDGAWPVVLCGTAVGVAACAVGWSGVRGRTAPSMPLLSAAPAGDGARRLRLELRVGATEVWRFAADESSAECARPIASFPVDAVGHVLDAPTEWLVPLRSWSLASVTQRQCQGHPAAEAYAEFCGPLDIPSRRWWIAELEVDPRLLPGYGTVDEALRRFSTRLRAHLAHRGISARVVDDAAAAAFRAAWLAAAPECRALVDSAKNHTATAPAAEALGAGVVLGADAAERAVCCELAGPHLSDVVWVGSVDVLSTLFLRCAAIGLRVVVVSDRPDEWHPLVGATGWDSRSGPVGGAPRETMLDSTVDAVLWDCATDVPPPLRRSDPAVPTMWHVLSRNAAPREEQLSRALARRPDLVVDARVAGWITLEIAESPGSGERSAVTVQEVGTAGEKALLDAAAAAPRTEDTLAV